MHHSIRRTASFAALIGLGLTAMQAQAAILTLPLGNVHTGADILNYYNGGNDSVPNDGTGPNLGITFSSNATAQKAGSSQSTGAGKFENNPSHQSEILYFSFATPATPNALDFGAGFTGLSFNYSLANNSSVDNSTVSIWSGLDGTGSLLDTLSLTAAATAVPCSVRTDSYCTWSLATTGPTNFGTARSVTFGGNATAQFSEFDGVQLTTAPVPLPATVWLMLSGLAGLTGTRLARRRRPHA
jgi:hypothetical protein